MKWKCRRRSISLVLLGAVAALFTAQPLWTEALLAEARTLNVAIVPLETAKAGSLAYVGRAVEDILASRLGRDRFLRVASLHPQRGSGTVAGTEKGGAGKSETVSRESDADYTVGGNVLSQGSEIGIELFLYAKESAAPVLSFTRTRPDLDAVVSDVEEFAAAATAFMLHGSSQALDPASGGDGEAASPPSGEDAIPARMHPDRLIRIHEKTAGSPGKAAGVVIPPLEDTVEATPGGTLDADGYATPDYPPPSQSAASREPPPRDGKKGWLSRILHPWGETQPEKTRAGQPETALPYPEPQGMNREEAISAERGPSDSGKETPQTPGFRWEWY